MVQMLSKVAIMTPAELRVVRESCGLSVAWVAERLGIDPKTVNRYETGNLAISENCKSLIEDIDTEITIAASNAVEDLKMFAPERRHYTVPRRSDGLEMPASYYRAIAARIRYEMPGVIIGYTK